jgi:3-hydroxyacyl-CoA dehydrogenase/enoyl-CoA hydratase/3-hydroxybutyryl-CoA epimerase
MGIGAPPHTGGYVQFVNTYGMDNFIQRCGQLSDKFGERFNCPEIVKTQAASGEMFS